MKRRDLLRHLESQGRELLRDRHQRPVLRWRIGFSRFAHQ